MHQIIERVAHGLRRLRPSQCAGIIVGGLALAQASAVQAGDLCVMCTGPVAAYRCQVDASAGAAATASDPRAQMLCITELAREGGHESCSVERSGAATCAGPVRVVTTGAKQPLPVTDVGGPVVTAAPASAGSPPPAGTVTGPGPTTDPVQSADKPAVGSDPRNADAAAGKPADGSKTTLQKAGQTIAKSADKASDVVTGTAKVAGEAVSDTAKTAGGAIGKAGSAVGHAAKSGWNCVVSLFKDC